MTDELIVFLRSDQAGRVKTRLAKAIGDEKARNVYQWLKDLTFQIARESKLAVQLYYDQLPCETEAEWDSHLQVSGDLGQRMSATIRERFMGGADRLLIIGSDCPEILPSDFEDALRALNQADLVLGPAHDGGVYLIGLKSENTSLFDGVAWSTESVFDKISDNANKQGLELITLDEKRDIDDLNDLIHFQREIEIPVNLEHDRSAI